MAYDTIKSEDGKIIEVQADTVITDPNSPLAVQVLPQVENPLAVHEEDAPVSDPTGGLTAIGDQASVPHGADNPSTPAVPAEKPKAKSKD